jgi:hypothetical protein
MPTPPLSFSSSINIVRDAGRGLTYHPTANTRRIVGQMLADYETGIRAFTLIGSYGTGKSAFLWALDQHLSGQQPYFGTSHFAGLPATAHIEIVQLVGEYRSLAQVLAERYNLPATANTAAILEALYYQHRSALTTGRLVLLIDEFGKFLEHAAENEPGAALYFMQALAEFASDPRHNALLLTTVHQNFDAYAFSLSQPQRQEWSKVKGRFREITFNEPVAQLLRLAAMHMPAARQSADAEALVMQTAELAARSRASDLNATEISDLATGLYPLEILAAHVLTITLQRYGQNERSLFSFLESSDHTGLRQFRRKHPDQFYHLGQVYDYLFFNFYAFLQSKHNPDSAAWNAIRGGLDEIDRTFDENIPAYTLLLKTIGLLNLTAAQGSTLDRSFLVNYARTALGIAEPGLLITELEQRHIILYRSHSKRFIPNNGTTLNVEAALVEVERRIAKSDAVAALLRRYDDLPPVLAKAYTYQTGTPRLFDFVITDELQTDVPSGDVDGFVYLIFNEQLTLEDVQAYSAQHSDGQAVVYVHYANTSAIIDILYELQKLEQVKADNADDRKAQELLDENLEATRRTLNHFILGNLYANSRSVRWIWRGQIIEIGSARAFNHLLSQACLAVYPDTPVFKNELVNRHKISPSIFTARKQYIRALVQDWDKPDLNFDKNKFPPEKTIYLTLLKANGISPSFNSRSLVHPDPNRFHRLWEASEAFLASAKERKRSVALLYQRLAAPPFKLKQGFLDFWIPTYLFLKRDDYALFSDKGYIPQLSEETLDLVVKYSEDYEIKTFDIEGVKLDLLNSYRTFAQQQDKLFVDNQTFVETIRPFLSFHRQLPDYAKNTKRLSKQALALRHAIVNSIDPEKTFFEDFPTALGYNVQALLGAPERLSEYTQSIENAIREIRHAYADLLNRFEHYLKTEVVDDLADFPAYRTQLQARFKRLNQPLLTPTQRVFLQRLNLTGPDRNAWLEAVAQTVLGKALEVSRDDDELVMYEKFQQLLSELDGLTSITASEINLHKETVLGVELNVFGDSTRKATIRLPKKQEQLIEHESDAMLKQMLAKSHGKQINLAILASALHKLLKP